jgi:PEGA domain
MNPLAKGRSLFCLSVFALSICALTALLPLLHADNKVLGEVDLVGASKVENTSGVWVDDQYVGYLGELKGSKKLLLLPGEHSITVRQGGYLDFVQKVSVRAGEKQSLNVKMEKDTRVSLPKITAEIKLDVKPNRAAVFVDGVLVGHVAEFGGVGHAMLVAPGKHAIKISLPGYQTFETDIDLVANQKSTVKTDMVAGGPAEGTPLTH